MTAATQNATHGSSRHFSSFNTQKRGMAAGMSNLTIKKSLLTFRFNTVFSRLTSTVSREQGSSDGRNISKYSF
jgi:hypothetical protein